MTAMISGETPLLPNGMIVGGHSGPRPSEHSRTLYLKAGDGFLGNTTGWSSLSEAEAAVREITAGPQQGAALIREFHGRYYAQPVYGLDTRGNLAPYHLESFAQQGTVQAGILNSAVRMIIDGQQTLTR